MGRSRTRKKASAPRPALLTIPAEIRTTILERVVLAPARQFIQIGKGLPREPAISMVSRRLRDESLTIFYNGNRFKTDLEDHDITPVEFMHAQMRRYETHALRVRYRIQWFEFWIDSCGEPHWDNLVHWVEEACAGRFPRHVVSGRPANRIEKGTIGVTMKTAVLQFEGMSEQTKRVFLNSFREVLTVIDARWGTDDDGTVAWRS